MSPPTATDNVPASQPAAKEVQKGAPKFKFPKVCSTPLELRFAVQLDNVVYKHILIDSDTVSSLAAHHL